MKKPNFLISAIRVALPVLFSIFLFSACDMLPSRKTLDLGRKMPFGMVEFYGDTMLMLHPGSQINTKITPSGAAFPLSDHALMLFFGGDLSSFYYYKQEDGKKINTVLLPGQLRINGKLSTVTLDSSEISYKWLRTYRPDSVSHLRVVIVGKDLPTDWYPRIFELAKINPNISFLSESFSESEGKDAILLSGLWKASMPEVFVGNETDVPQVDLRAAKALYLNKTDSLLPEGFFESLSKIPPDARIWLDGFEGADIRQILERVKPAELALENTELADPAVLASWQGLKALFCADSLADLRPLKELTALEMLGITTKKGAVGLESLKGLHYLSIASDSAAAFSVLRQNPGLEFLHLDVDSLSSFPGFRDLKQLKGIAFPDFGFEDFSPIRQWDIAYIGMPVSDSLLQVIQSYRPESMVYAQGSDFWGACLGSGWLLLLLPLIWLFVWVKSLFHVRKD